MKVQLLPDSSYYVPPTVIFSFSSFLFILLSCNTSLFSLHFSQSPYLPSPPAPLFLSFSSKKRQSPRDVNRTRHTPLLKRETYLVSIPLSLPIATMEHIDYTAFLVYDCYLDIPRYIQCGEDVQRMQVN